MKLGRDGKRGAARRSFCVWRGLALRRPRDPTRTALYGLVAGQRATFAAVTADAGGVPTFVDASFERFLFYARRVCYRDTDARRA